MIVEEQEVLSPSITETRSAPPMTVRRPGRRRYRNSPSLRIQWKTGDNKYERAALLVLWVSVLVGIVMALSVVG